MKPFILFSFDDFYPEGGVSDIVSTHWDLDSAKAAAEQLLDEEQAENNGKIYDNRNQHILDTKTGRNYIRYITAAGYEWEPGETIK